MNKQIPTLKEAVDHVKKNGGHFKGRGNGKVEWIEEEVPSAEQLVGETPISFSELTKEDWHEEEAMVGII